MNTKRNTKHEAGTKAIGYVRVSTDEQHLGPEAQRDALARWCAVNGYELALVCEDLGISGAAKLDRRPGMLAALAALEEHGAAVLLVAKRDRLARDPLAAAMIEAGAARHGARVVSAAGEGTESDDPTAVLMRRMVDAFAEYERLIIRARTKAALTVKASRGERTGEIPFGYRLDVDGVHLIEDLDEQTAIALIRQLRADGLSQRDIAARLNLDAVPARGSKWHPTTIARLLARDVA